jgi:hypothetical protein
MNNGFIILGQIDTFDGEQLYWVNDNGWYAGKEYATIFPMSQYHSPTLVEETGRELV